MRARGASREMRKFVSESEESFGTSEHKHPSNGGPSLTPLFPALFVESESKEPFTAMKSCLLLPIAASLLATASGFAVVPTSSATFSAASARPAQNGDESDADSGGFKFNPLKEILETFKNLDDVIDDFYNKRMGNGEIFYGQRKYKPSGKDNTNGDYTGGGLSDFGRIEAARAFREERDFRREMEELRRANDERDRSSR